jgi:hypothetical protein
MECRCTRSPQRRSRMVYTSGHTSRGSGANRGHLRMPLGDAIGLPATQLHSVWGRMVPDVPDFCRELVAALAEE